jgi:hypothetical protein
MPHDLAAEHLTLDELADLSVDELADEISPSSVDHLAGCATCRSALAELRTELDLVSAELGALGPQERPAPVPMPVTIAARLDRVLAEEASARWSGTQQAPVPGNVDPALPGALPGPERPGTVTPLRRPPLKAPATASYVKQTGVLRIMLAAAVAAAVVGFGGYVVSATAGLNEPSALSPTQVHPEALASQAAALAASRDLDPHLFSAAWRCSRKVVSGRITGITPVYVDGQQNYLVYSRAGRITYATLVSDCGAPNPTAGRPVRLTP